MESCAARADRDGALNGRSAVRPRFGYDGCLDCALPGTARGCRLERALVTDSAASDTVEVRTGELRADTIMARYRGFGGTAGFAWRR